MSHWTDLLLDKRKIIYIYGDELPSLNEVNIHEIVFHRDGPRVTFRVDLAEYPSIPPVKWVKNEFNTVQVQLECLDIKYSILEGWVDTSLLSIINVSKEGGLVNFSLKCGKLYVCIKSVFLDINSISAYCCPDRSPLASVR